MFIIIKNEQKKLCMLQWVFVLYVYFGKLKLSSNSVYSQFQSVPITFSFNYPINLILFGKNFALEHAIAGHSAGQFVLLTVIKLRKYSTLKISPLFQKKWCFCLIFNNLKYSPLTQIFYNLSNIFIQSCVQDIMKYIYIHLHSQNWNEKKNEARIESKASSVTVINFSCLFCFITLFFSFFFFFTILNQIITHTLLRMAFLFFFWYSVGSVTSLNAKIHKE